MSSNKAKTKELLDRLILMKYDNVGGVRAYVMKMVGMAAKLNEIKIPVAEPFIVHHDLNSLPSQFGHLKVLIQLKRTTGTLMILLLFVPKKKEEFFMK